MPQTRYVPDEDLRDVVTIRLKRYAVDKINKYCRANNVSRSAVIQDLVLENIDSFNIPEE